jgi:hypothetical protein
MLFKRMLFKRMLFERMLFERMLFERMLFKRMLFKRMLFKRMLFERMLFERTTPKFQKNVIRPRPIETYLVIDSSMSLSSSSSSSLLSLSLDFMKGNFRLKAIFWPFVRLCWKVPAVRSKLVELRLPWNWIRLIFFPC